MHNETACEEQPTNTVGGPRFRRAFGQGAHAGVGLMGMLESTHDFAAPRPSIGEPILTASLGGWDATVWVLSDGTAILKIGCQTRPLANWRSDMDGILSRSAPEGAYLKPVLQHFLSFVDGMLEEMKPGKGPVSEDPA